MKYKSYLESLAQLIDSSEIDTEGDSIVTIVLNGNDQAVVTEKVIHGKDKGRVRIYDVEEEYSENDDGMRLVLQSEVKPLPETLIADVTKILELSHEQSNIG